MAASVKNIQYSHLQPGLTTMVRGFSAGANHRSNSPVRGCNFPVQEIPPPTNTTLLDYSSSDSDEQDPDWTQKNNNETEPLIFDPRDEGTSDGWIKRHPSLIRLTGKHPFNSEPPLTKLMHHGFITPASIHYVRSHGAVPKANWDDWTVEICGLVKRPTKFTMSQLVNEFKPSEFPVTLVCAGNRRKEQNMVKQTIGFNWGSAGISTSVWCGVRLRDVLKRCGVFSRKKGALNVCFEGAEDLPGGGGSKYGTSIRIEVAMDPSRDILIAYMQNMEVLTPDHGFPVRMIIPGFIGGRMVKWLKRIIVTTEESQNYYHYRDNKVLPSHVDDELANAEAWWYKPEYVINELNINSVVTSPGHEEILNLNSATMQKPYKLRGYAYSGGGKKVTRVEVTMDGGDTWVVCSIERPEKPNKYGRYWCWCFWSLEVEVLDLLRSKEIAVRAWDETHNTQPEKLIWNLMGMMNNCWFRVKMNVCKPHKDEIELVFEHPTQPANQPGGWMAPQKHLEKSESQPLKKSIYTPLVNTFSKQFSMSEVKKHNSPDSPWIVVHGHVYDCTNFLNDHPGGSDSILINAGTDCTEEFDAIHSDKAKAMLDDFRIGELITSNAIVHEASDFSNLATINEVSIQKKNALIPGQKIQCKLISKISISHDVSVFRFALPAKHQVLGLPVGKHIFLSATIDNKLCIRAYTPTSFVDEVGHFDLLVKIYFKGTHPKFPNGGLMSQHLQSLPIGAMLDIKGPLGHIEYMGRGNFTVHGKHKFARRLAMIAGGTGITPIYQVIQSILKDPTDDTEMYLVYANRTEEDILLREEIDGWAEKNPNLKVWYVISNSIREGWRYSTGHITENILREHIPVPEGSRDTLALVCGPPLMIQSAVLPNLEKMNYDVKNSCLTF
ncbi:nitrate reductase [NADH]-like [Tasmannia lanceolata]|uniref:nitrate reductase [NADH]-like n=1 Tax=Tasmannia lanceolata TaxID=3420 RepID=UPI0040631F8E